MLSLFCKGLFLPYCHKMLCVSLLDTSNEIRDIFFSCPLSDRVEDEGRGVATKKHHFLHLFAA